MTTEPIAFYPKGYSFTEEMTRFFTHITNDESLQQQLRQTKTLLEVADIANGLGFDVSGAQILQAQAGRVLAMIDEHTDDINRLISGQVPHTGAQWGRGGGGYLDDAGTWLKLLASDHTINAMDDQVNQFLLTPQAKQLNQAKTFQALETLWQQAGFKITAVDLMAHQAQKILALTPDEAQALAKR